MNTSAVITPYSNPALCQSSTMGVKQEGRERTVSMLFSLPDALFHQIFTYLTTRDLARCSRTFRVMRTEVTGYTTKYREIWNTTLLTIANPVSELARAILNRGIADHIKIARIAAGMPKAVKQEIANEISQEGPASERKAKALALLEAPATQIESASNTTEVNRVSLLYIALSMAYAGCRLEDLIASIERIAGLWIRDNIYGEVAKAMAARGARQQMLLVIIEKIRQGGWRDATCVDVAKTMAARGAGSEELLPIIGKIIGAWDRDFAFSEVAKAMAARGVRPEELLAIIGRISASRRPVAFLKIAEAMAARGAGQEEQLAIMEMIETVEKRDWACWLPIIGKIGTRWSDYDFCALAETMAAGGVEERALLPVIGKIKAAELRNRVDIAIAKAMTARDAGELALLPIMNEIEKSNSQLSDSVRYKLAKAMVAGSAEQLLTIIRQIRDVEMRRITYCKIAKMMAERGAGQTGLLTIMELMGFLGGYESDFEIVKAMAGRGTALEEILGVLTV
ncbi:MAG: F-box protein [Verrucomicrobiota bacterium]|nr:F-box protein [Verrucomicrobiota bacterium]